MTNIAGACVMIGVVGTVMCMMFMIAAADAALDGNDALEQYYGMMAVLSLTGAFFGFDQAMKEAGVTADQLAVAKENASTVTESNVDINFAFKGVPGITEVPWAKNIKIKGFK